jgi:D-alanyl-D-alanine carboxypeptidase/D-alanyl-D-alanine-endopeptidase (penicillin-binding protein 4)
MRNALLLVFCLLNGALWAQPAWQDALNRLSSDPELRGAQISGTVVDVLSNRLLAVHNPHQVLVPASSLKIVSTATAMVTLGAEYRFKTHLQYDGYIDREGVLHGNLYLYGTGDPTLGSPVMPGVLQLNELLDLWCRKVEQQGIKSVTGKVIGDASHFDEVPLPEGWDEEDWGNYYGAGAWALNIHDNLYYLDFNKTEQGKRPGIASVRPKVPGLQFVNELRSAGPRSGDNAYIWGQPYTYSRKLTGSIPSGKGSFRIKGSLPDPPLQAAQWFRQALIDSGISVQGEAATLRQLNSKEHPEQRRINLLILTSPPLHEIVLRANRESMNLYCEVLLKAVGKKRHHQGTRLAGLRGVQDVWEERGLSMQGQQILDGSGLSRNNRVSSYVLAQVLRKALIDPSNGTRFRESLSVAGESGTLEPLLQGTAGQGRVLAKSGSMRGVRSYTGMVRREDGQDVVFSVIINDCPCSSAVTQRKIAAFMLELTVMQ